MLERILSRDNLLLAWKRVKANKGKPGVDGITVDDFPVYLREHWPQIKIKLLNGSYRPQAVLRVEIPKRSGGKRPLGIPTVLDRLIQQAILQVLQPLFDPGFSESSYGFRPKLGHFDDAPAGKAVGLHQRLDDLLCFVRILSIAT